jgi:outer membrane protein
MTNQPGSKRLCPAVFIGLLLASTSAPAITLRQALDMSLKNYPSIRVSQEDMNAAGARIQLARTAYLPKVDALAQVSRATRNNVFGLLLPQSVIPSISGPVIGSNNLGSVWGSGLGALVSWEPFDFGLRRANVAAASAARAQAEAAVKRTQFDVIIATADAYLTVVATQEAVKAAQAGVDRAAVLVRTISSQVNAGLRPGAEKSRAQAEEAAAHTQLIQVDQAV